MWGSVDRVPYIQPIYDGGGFNYSGFFASAMTQQTRKSSINGRKISRVMTDGRHRIPWVEYILAYIILHLVGQQATLDTNNLKLPGRMSKIWSPCHSIWLLHPYHCQLPFFWRPAFRTCVTLSNRSLLCNITLFYFTAELSTFFKSECSKEGSCFCCKGLSLRRRPPRLW